MSRFWIELMQAVMLKALFHRLIGVEILTYKYFRNIFD